MNDYNLKLTPLEVCNLMDILYMSDRKDLELNKLQDSHLSILKKTEALDNKVHENHSIRKLRENKEKWGKRDEQTKNP